MISKEEVKHIAKLSRLELTEQEIEKMQKDISAVLDYFELLKKIPKQAGIANVSGKKSIGIEETRKDEVISSYNIRDELIGKYPAKKDDYIKVKTIL
jgi:aspartyl-tRNA(Asn)/glutamyl-tRNA(Gln) amidotransferase subunit C